MWSEFGKEQSDSNSDKEDKPAFGNVWGEETAQDNEEEFDHFQGADGWAANAWTPANQEPVVEEEKSQPELPAQEPQPHKSEEKSAQSSEKAKSENEEEEDDNWGFAEPLVPQ